MYYSIRIWKYKTYIFVVYKKRKGLIIMSAIILNIFNVFENVIDVFNGSYSNDNAELKKMRHELDDPIPTVREDRKNLKIDGSKVSADFNKAFEEKKAELLTHG